LELFKRKSKESNKIIHKNSSPGREDGFKVKMELPINYF
jgi:hypothetical protein